MNNTYKIKIESPILRPGLTIETECSEDYAKKVTLKLLDVAREINEAKTAKVDPCKVIEKAPVMISENEHLCK